MNEFGETPSYYINPIGHVEGEPYPDDFEDRLAWALSLAGLESERV